MSDIRIDIILIGNLAHNPYWGEKSPVREEYSTVTLIRSGKAVIVADPGWSADVLRAALFYRAGLEPEAVTHVFLTHFDASHFRGIGLFAKARWLAYDEELKFAEAEVDESDPGRAVLRRLDAAPEKLAPGVDLFPTFGHSPGHASLIVYTAIESTIVAGDAVLTRDHFERGDLGEGPWDLQKARTSLQDVIEIADAVVPGHDNSFPCHAGSGLV